MREKSVFTSRIKTKKLLEFALSKKPKEPLVLELRGLNLIWDYFIIVTAEAPTHNEAILEELIKKSKEKGFDIHHIEKDSEGGWTLIDYFDVAFHIFSEEKRNFYRLEKLFKRARKVKFRFKSVWEKEA